MQRLEQLKLGDSIRYQRASGEWITYNMLQSSPSHFANDDHRFTYTLIRNHEQNTPEIEKFAVLLDYETSNENNRIDLANFFENFIKDVIPINSRIFIIREALPNQEFILSHSLRWQLPDVPNIFKRIYFTGPNMVPGIYQTSRLRGIPIPVVSQPPPAKPVVHRGELPVILARPPKPTFFQNPPNIPANIPRIERYTTEQKISLADYQQRFAKFMDEEKFKKLPITPRPYQIEDLTRLNEGLKKCTQTTYSVVQPSPTGYGKTVYASFLIEALRVRTLVIVPTTILLDQALVEFKKVMPNARVSIYRSYQRFERVFKDNDIVLTTIQMLQYNDRAQSKHVMDVIKRNVSLVIFDEVHICMSEARNNIIKSCIEANCHVIGMTATPDEKVYTAFGYNKDGNDNPIPKRSLSEYIELGILPRVSLQMLVCPAVYSGNAASTEKKSSEDTDEDNDVDSDDKEDTKLTNHLFVDCYFNKSDSTTNRFYFGMKTIIFVSRTKDADDLAALFNKAILNNQDHPKVSPFLSQFQTNGGVSFAAAVHGKTRKYQTVIDNFRANKIQILIGVQKIAVGFDVKDVELLFVPNSITSVTLLLQAAGRGFRTPSHLMQISPDGKLINNKIIHFVQIFEGSKHICYLFNELKVKINGKKVIKFNHKIGPEQVSAAPLPEHSRITSGMRVDYTLCNEPEQIDKDIFRKLERREIHNIIGRTITRDQFDKIPIAIRNILIALDEHHQKIEEKLEAFTNTEVHTEHIVKRKNGIALNDESEGHAVKRNKIREASTSDRPSLGITHAHKKNITDRIDDIIERFEDIHTESGDKSGYRSNGKSTKRKSAENGSSITKLIAEALATYKRLYVKLETFENELLFREQMLFGQNLEALINETDKYLTELTDKRERGLIPAFPITIYFSNVIRKHKLDTLKKFFLKGIESYIYKDSQEFNRVKDITYILRKNKREESINDLESILDELLKLKLKDDKVSAFNTLALVIQYLQIEPETARKLLEKIANIDIDQSPFMTNFAAAILFLSKDSLHGLFFENFSQKNASIFVEIQKLFNLNVPLLERLKIAFKYKLFYECQKLLHEAISTHVLEEISFDLQESYLDMVVGYTYNAAHTTRLVMEHCDYTSHVAKHLYKHLILAHHGAIGQNAYFVRSSKWKELTGFIGEMIKLELKEDSTKLPDLTMRNTIFTTELRHHTARDHWLLLPIFADMIIQYPHLTPKMTTYGKQRILLLYIYMRDNNLLNDELKEMLFNILRNRSISIFRNLVGADPFTFESYVFESDIVVKAMDAYFEIDTECTFSEVFCILNHHIKHRFQTVSATGKEVESCIRLILHFTKKYQSPAQIAEWLPLVMSLVQESFAYSDDLSVSDDDFINHYFKPLLELLKTHKENDTFPTNALLGYLHSRELRSAQSNNLVFTMFQLIYNEIASNNVSLRSSILYPFVSSANDSSERILTLTKMLDLDAFDVFKTFATTWVDSVLERRKPAPIHQLGELLLHFSTKGNYLAPDIFFKKEYMKLPAPEYYRWSNLEYWPGYLNLNITASWNSKITLTVPTLALFLFSLNSFFHLIQLSNSGDIEEFSKILRMVPLFTNLSESTTDVRVKECCQFYIDEMTRIVDELQSDRIDKSNSEKFIGDQLSTLLAVQIRKLNSLAVSYGSFLNITFDFILPDCDTFGKNQYIKFDTNYFTSSADLKTFCLLLTPDSKMASLLMSANKKDNEKEINTTPTLTSQINTSTASTSSQSVNAPNNNNELFDFVTPFNFFQPFDNGDNLADIHSFYKLDH